MLFNPLFKGFTLIEALISLVILSIAMLGILELQFQLIRNAQSLYFYSQALQQAQNAAEIQKAGSFSQALAFLKTEISSILPEGELSVDAAGDETRIEVQWQEIESGNNNFPTDIQLWTMP